MKLLRTTVLGLAGLLVGGACANSQSGHSTRGDIDVATDAVLDTAAASPPSESVARDVLRLREEEKLARDVYSRLHEAWGLQPFANIGASEQQHMDRIATHLAPLGLVDPVVDDTRGVFQDPEIASLYASLTTDGLVSEVAALRVGATIEDLDIFDIRAMKANTQDPGLLATYGALECGSRNHMRAFYGQLEQRGEAYTAQFLTASDLQAILDGGHESCGEGAGGGRGRGPGR